MKQNIFNYSDYRTFLRDHVQTQKESKPLWSLGQWSRRLEFANTSVLTNILNGVRHPGQNIVERFVDYFQFSDEENNYFRNLVRLQKKYSDPELRVLIMEKLKNSHPEKKFKLLDDETFQMISKWHYYAIRELVNLSDFKEDIAWIRARLKFEVSIPDIKKALKDLERLSLLARDAKGCLMYAGGSVRSSTDVALEGLKRFHEEMIAIARE
ncbi:MAG: TIGR02147 family protein, partial [Bdellovibrionales bacterium]